MAGVTLGSVPRCHVHNVGNDTGFFGFSVYVTVLFGGSQEKQEVYRLGDVGWFMLEPVSNGSTAASLAYRLAEAKARPPCDPRSLVMLCSTTLSRESSDNKAGDPDKKRSYVTNQCFSSFPPPC